MGKLVLAKNITINYNDTQIIKPSSFSINSGDFVFVTGISGSGKTTLIKTLYAEHKIQSGEMYIGEFNLTKINKSKISLLRKHLGVVFQDFKLISEWSIIKNVMLPLLITGIEKSQAEQMAMQYLNKVKLSHKADKFPPELSGGEQQRAAIARATIHNPVMILADEPISGLDEYSASLVMDLFIEANKIGITIVIASHSIPQNFDILFKQLHIEKGKIHELS